MTEQNTDRKKMSRLNLSLPAAARIALKTRAVEQETTAARVVLQALIAAGIVSAPAATERAERKG